MSGLRMTPTRIVSAALFVGLGLVPVYAAMFDAPYYVSLSRAS
jgi:hypothetical protein